MRFRDDSPFEAVGKQRPVDRRVGPARQTDIKGYIDGGHRPPYCYCGRLNDESCT
jgi:hypothetical protein